MEKKTLASTHWLFSDKIPLLHILSFLPAASLFTLGTLYPWIANHIDQTLQERYNTPRSANHANVKQVKHNLITSLMTNTYSHELQGAWVDDPRYWKSVRCRDYSFPYCHTLLYVCWLDVYCVVPLKKRGQYEVFLLCDLTKCPQILRPNVQEDGEETGGGLEIKLREDAFFPRHQGFWNYSLGEVCVGERDAKVRVGLSNKNGDWKGGVRVLGAVALPMGEGELAQEISKYVNETFVRGILEENGEEEVGR